MITLTGKTLFCGEASSGKSALLTALAQTAMSAQTGLRMMYYGTSLSYEMFSGEKENDPRYHFLPVYRHPFNRQSPGVGKLLTALAGIAGSAAAVAAPLLLVIDEPQHLFADSGGARKFAAAVKQFAGGRSQKLTLMMTTETIKNIETLFGS